MIALTLSQAIVGLTEGHVLWCVPSGYIGWWTALGPNGVLYEHSIGSWERSKKGVSTIMGAEWYIRRPEDPRKDPPEFQHTYYESPSFLAHEAKKRLPPGELTAVLADIRNELQRLNARFDQMQDSE